MSRLTSSGLRSYVVGDDDDDRPDQPHVVSIKIVTISEGTICYRVFSPLEMESIETLRDLRVILESDFPEFEQYEFKEHKYSSEPLVAFALDLDARSNFRVEVDVRKTSGEATLPLGAAPRQRDVIRLALPDAYDDRETGDQRYVFVQLTDDVGILSTKRLYFRSEPARSAFCFYASRVSALNLGEPLVHVNFDDVLCVCPTVSCDDDSYGYRVASFGSARTNEKSSESSSSAKSGSEKPPKKKFSLAIALKVGRPLVLLLESFYALAGVAQSVTHRSILRPRLCLAAISHCTWEFNDPLLEILFDVDNVLSVELRDSESKLGVKLGPGAGYNVVVVEIVSNEGHGLRVGDAVKRLGDVFDVESGQPASWRELTNALKSAPRPLMLEFLRTRDARA